MRGVRREKFVGSVRLNEYNSMAEWSAPPDGSMRLTLDEIKYFLVRFLADQSHMKQSGLSDYFKKTDDFLVRRFYLYFKRDKIFCS